MKLLVFALSLITGLVLSATKAPAQVEVDPDHAMVIDGVIQGDNLKAVKDALLKSPDGANVDLIINSPGGSVTTGFEFISVMESAKANGVRINCFVPHVAASMAFQILLHCDNRYVLDKSFLLWHRARVMMGGFGGSPMTAPQLSVLSRDLANTDALILQEVARYVDEPMSAITYHFENETLHVGENLAKDAPRAFTSYVSIPGLFEALDNAKIPRTVQEGGLFGIFRRNQIIDLSKFRFGEMIYISNVSK